jgi:hypothetical protein
MAAGLWKGSEVFLGLLGRKWEGYFGMNAQAIHLNLLFCHLWMVFRKFPFEDK